MSKSDFYRTEFTELHYSKFLKSKILIIHITHGSRKFIIPKILQSQIFTILKIHNPENFNIPEIHYLTAHYPDIMFQPNRILIYFLDKLLLHKYL